MATDQFNIRLRDGLDRQVRIRAAQLGCKPRDVIEEALVASGLKRDASPVDPGQLALPTPAAPAPRAKAGASRRRGTPPRSVVDPDDATAAGSTPASPPTGCPECAGDLTDGVCTECGWRGANNTP